MFFNTLVCFAHLNCHDITEILLKVVINTITLTLTQSEAKVAILDLKSLWKVATIIQDPWRNIFGKFDGLPCSSTVEVENLWIRHSRWPPPQDFVFNIGSPPIIQHGCCYSTYNFDYRSHLNLHRQMKWWSLVCSLSKLCMKNQISIQNNYIMKIIKFCKWQK